MAERECAVNGKKKSISGGKICEKNHFICKDRAWGKLTAQFAERGSSRQVGLSCK
jgi:hypothetical protein